MTLRDGMATPVMQTVPFAERPRVQFPLFERQIRVYGLSMLEAISAVAAAIAAAIAACYREQQRRQTLFDHRKITTMLASKQPELLPPYLRALVGDHRRAARRIRWH
jgi:hypothetical protein